MLVMPAAPTAAMACFTALELLRLSVKISLAQTQSEPKAACPGSSVARPRSGMSSSTDASSTSPVTICRMLIQMVTKHAIEQHVR